MQSWHALSWFRIAALLLIASSLVLGGLSLDAALREKWRTEVSLERLEVFDAAFGAATALNAERRPLELALGSEGTARRPQMAELTGARMATDVAISRFQAGARRNPEFGRMNFAFLLAKLRAERTRADELMALPLAERRLGDKLSVMRGMVSAAETIEPMVGNAARAVIAADPNLAGPVNVARIIGALYEAATRMSSEVMPTIYAGAILPPEIRMASLRTQQRILALWDVGASQLEFAAGSELLATAVSDIREHYFGKGFPFLARAVERYANRLPKAAEGAQTIARVYQPSVAPIARLRNLYVSSMMKQARRSQAQAVQQATVAVGLTGLILLVVPILLWTTYRELLVPLFEFRERILAICRGGTVVRRPYLGSVSAMRNLYRALETLQDREEERRALDLERIDLSRRLRELSETDDLTGVLNRRGLFQALESFGDSDAEYALVLGDIDHFKAVNDGLGHAAGDEVLRRFGAMLRRRLGADVVAARYGGEEFAIAIRAERPESILGLVEDLRLELQETDMEVRPGTVTRVTGSFGVALRRGPIPNWDELLREADAALYGAKAAGRNRVRATNHLLATLAASRRPGEDMQAGLRERA